MKVAEGESKAGPSNNGDGDGDGDGDGGGLTAQQRRLQQMISMQHAQQAQLMRYRSMENSTTSTPPMTPRGRDRGHQGTQLSAVTRDGHGGGGGGDEDGAAAVTSSPITNAGQGVMEILADDGTVSTKTISPPRPAPAAAAAVKGDAGASLSGGGGDGGGDGDGDGDGSGGGGMHFHSYAQRRTRDVIAAAGPPPPGFDDTPAMTPLVSKAHAAAGTGIGEVVGGGAPTGGMRRMIPGAANFLFRNSEQQQEQQQDSSLHQLLIPRDEPTSSASLSRPSHGAHDVGGTALAPPPENRPHLYYQSLSEPRYTPAYHTADSVSPGHQLGRIGGGGGPASSSGSQTGLALADMGMHRSHHSEHQFHYGNTDHNDSSYDREFPYHHGYGEERSSCGLLRSITSCLGALLTAENLHRSICFGAIDGMLTGSGITAACAGLGFLSAPHSSSSSAYSAPSSKQLVAIALSLAACTSDGVCMAIGHVWSTYVLHRASLRERKEERSRFAQDRAEAKARLVDMLLGRGMLKIDAMSIADTLEGYPDIFVSALVGDTGHTLGDPSDPGIGGNGGGGGGGGGWGGDWGAGGPTNHPHHGGGALGLAKSSSRGGGAGGLLNPEDGDLRGHYAAPLHHYPTTTYGSSGRGSSMGRETNYYGSYGQFNEFEDDPDMASMSFAMKDGWCEGIMMMLSFCIFSVVPSVIFVSVPILLPSEYSRPQSYYDPRDGGISPTTVSMGIISTIMLLLGVWKSHFFDSNWIIFGIETVLVLFLCVVCAYSIGFVCSGFLPHH